MKDYKCDINYQNMRIIIKIWCVINNNYHINKNILKNQLLVCTLKKKIGRY